MKSIALIAIVFLLCGCAPQSRARVEPKTQDPAVLRKDFRVSDVQRTALCLAIPDKDTVSREEAVAFVNALLKEATSRQWAVPETAQTVVLKKLNFKTPGSDLARQLNIDETDDWVLIAQLNAYNTFAVAPKADFRETGGIISRDGTRIPNPTICLVVEVTCALLDTKRAELAWMDKREVGPVIKGHPMKYEDMTPDLLKKMVESTFRSLPTRRGQ